MSMQRIMFVTASVLLAATAAATPASGLKWMDATTAGLPAGAKIAVVSGNPAKEGPFVIRALLPANYAVPPHHHPTDEAVRVLAGGPLTYGMGTKADNANSGTLNKGYHITMPATMNHWVSNAAATTIQVSGDGPFAITYVNPSDDPRNKQP
jgi:hypothetical protein